MAFEIVWSNRAIKGYEKIIRYLEENWTDKEVAKFVVEADKFFELLQQHPELLQKSNSQKNVYRGPINKLTILTYRVQFRKKQIALVNIRGARQKPLK